MVLKTQVFVSLKIMVQTRELIIDSLGHFSNHSYIKFYKLKVVVQDDF